MRPRVYTSQQDFVPAKSTSIFTHLFASRVSGGADLGGYPGSAAAFIDAATGTTLTRAQLLDLALRFSHGIRTHPGTARLAHPGATVLIYAPNALAWPVILHGCIAAGLRCTLANSGYTPGELAYQYVDSGAGLVITEEGGMNNVRAMFEELKMDRPPPTIMFNAQDFRWAGGPGLRRAPAPSVVTLEDLLERGKLEREHRFDDENALETVLLCYSSGTTGRPKGVETTHENLTLILDIMRHLFPPLQPGKNTVFSILPFYHLYGTAMLLCQCFTLGWTVLIQSQFDPGQFCAAIEKYKVAYAFVVPPILLMLARHPVVDEHDLSSLEYLFSAAAPLSPELVTQVKTRLLAKRVSGAKCLITQGYGLTETTTGITLLPFAEGERKTGSVGPLLPTLEARIVRDEKGEVDAEEGESGELWVRGKTIMKGYLGNPTATKDAITSDGWFKTGDIVERDKEGFFYVVDRKKELIKYKGFQVPPAELEAVLLTHPDIADAAVIGIESAEQATEFPRAYIVHARPQTLANVSAEREFEASVVRWIQSKVAKHKHLRGGAKVIDVVPKSPSGKVLRRELRELAKTERARGEIGMGLQSQTKL